MYATYVDVEHAWRPLSAEEAIVADSTLEYAGALLRQAVPDLDDRILTGKSDPILVRAACVQMVIRVMRNPEALKQHTDTMGPFAEAKTYDPVQAAGFLELLPSDLALILPGAGKPRVRNINLRPGLR